MANRMRYRLTQSDNGSWHISVWRLFYWRLVDIRTPLSRAVERLRELDPEHE